jgi:hypothetical protein
MTDDDDDVVSVWATGPQHALDRLPREMKIPVLRRMLARLERANAPKRPRRRKRVSVHQAASSKEGD